VLWSKTGAPTGCAAKSGAGCECRPPAVRLGIPRRMAYCRYQFFSVLPPTALIASGTYPCHIHATSDIVAIRAATCSQVVHDLIIDGASVVGSQVPVKVMLVGSAELEEVRSLIQERSSRNMWSCPSQNLVRTLLRIQIVWCKQTPRGLTLPVAEPLQDQATAVCWDIPGPPGPCPPVK